MCLLFLKPRLMLVFLTVIFELMAIAFVVMTGRSAGEGYIYVRSDIYFARMNKLDGISPENLVNFKTETIIIKIKLGNAWIAIVGVYRPPSIAKSIWINELSKLFQVGSMLADTIYYAGDFNVSFLNPDEPSSERRSLMDLLDICNLDCLISGATRKTKTSETLLDLILTNNKRKTLVSGVVDTQISNHSLVYTVLKSSAPKLQSRKIFCRSLKSYYSRKVFARSVYGTFSYNRHIR